MIFNPSIHQARQLADKHETDASSIEKAAYKARNDSTKAYDTAFAARKKNEDMKSKLKMMEISMDQAKKLAKESEDLINDARKSANSTIDQAVKLIAEGKAPLPDFGHKERSGECSLVL